MNLKMGPIEEEAIIARITDAQARRVSFQVASVAMLEDGNCGGLVGWWVDAVILQERYRSGNTC